MAIKELKQSRFDGGLSDNPRDVSGNKFWYSENLILGDTVSQSSALTKNGSTYDKTYRIVKLLEVGTEIYGLGQDNTTDKKTCIYYKLRGSGNNFTLVTPSTNAQLVDTDPFMVSDGGYVYFVNGGYISQLTVSNHSVDYDWATLPVASLRGGITWQGNLYGYYGQVIYKIPPATGVPVDLITIPLDQTIRQLVAYGNCMLIVCSSTVGISKMYIWDGITTTTFNDIIDIGVGSVVGGGIKDGSVYVAILKRQYELNILRYANGNFGVVKSYDSKPNRAGTYNYLNVMNPVKSTGNSLYFMLYGTKSDSALASLSEAQVFIFSDDELQQNSLYNLSCPDSTVTGGTMSNIGDVLLSERVASEEKYHVVAVIDGIGGANTSYFYETTEGTYTNTAVLETSTFNCGDISLRKQLRAISLSHNANPTTGQVVVKYKKDDDIEKAAATWTTIMTDTTDLSLYKSTVKIESTGVNLPVFNEIKFRIEFTGGADIIAFKMKYEELSDINY